MLQAIKQDLQVQRGRNKKLEEKHYRQEEMGENHESMVIKHL